MNFIAVVSIVELASIHAHNFLSSRVERSAVWGEINGAIANMGAEELIHFTFQLCQDMVPGTPWMLFAALLAWTQGLCTSHVTVCDNLNQII